MYKTISFYIQQLNISETTISLEDFSEVQVQKKQQLEDQALDFLSQELAQELKKSWNNPQAKILEHAQNLILGEVNLDDNSISDDEEGREPSRLQKVYTEKKQKFELIREEHFLLLSAPITTKRKSQKAEKELRKNQYEQFCKASPLLQNESNYTETEVTYKDKLRKPIRVMLKKKIKS